jgi:hypothetical protein
VDEDEDEKGGGREGEGIHRSLFPTHCVFSAHCTFFHSSSLFFTRTIVSQLTMALDCIVRTIAEFKVDDLHFLVEGHVNPVKKSVDGGMGVSKARAKVRVYFR